MPEGERPSGPLEMRALFTTETPSGDLTRLLRASARASLKHTALLTRAEAIAALPLRAKQAGWLDATVKPARVVDGEPLSCGATSPSRCSAPPRHPSCPRTRAT